MHSCLHDGPADATAGWPRGEGDCAGGGGRTVWWRRDRQASPTPRRLGQSGGAVVAEAIHSGEMEGLLVSVAGQADAQEYVAGTIDADELVARARARHGLV